MHGGTAEGRDGACRKSSAGGLFFMKTPSLSPRRFAAGRLLAISLVAGLSLGPVGATFNYEYGDDEYVTVAAGQSPDGKYAITAHGGGELGLDHFHIYLTDAVKGKKIGPLEEIDCVLDTGAGAFAAKWAKDSSEVTIVNRYDRHEPLQYYTYRIAKGRATLTGAGDADKRMGEYWSKHCSEVHPPGKTYGTPKKP